MTRVTVDLVFTAPSVLTGTAGTLVDVCGDSFIEEHQCASKRAEEGGGVVRKRAGGGGIVRKRVVGWSGRGWWGGQEEGRGRGDC